MSNSLLPDQVQETGPELTSAASAKSTQASEAAEDNAEAQASSTVRDLPEGNAVGDEVADIRNLFPKTLTTGKSERKEEKRVKSNPTDEPGEASEKRKFFNQLEGLDQDSEEEPDLEKLDREDRQRLKKERDLQSEQAKAQAEGWYVEEVARMKSQRRVEHAAWNIRSAQRAREVGKGPVLPDSMPSLSWSDSQVDNGGSHSPSWSDPQVDIGGTTKRG